MLRVVREASAQDRVLLSSFNPLCLARARVLWPGLPRALLFERAQPLWLRSAASAPLIGAVALHPEAVLATPAAVASWRARGCLVTCWTVDDAAVARRLVASGVAGLITNRPGELRRALALE